MNGNKGRWLLLGIVVGGAFCLLGFFRREVYRQAPPIPARVVTTSGAVLMTGEQILDGQQAWQSIGGQQVGSIWGHGAYQAPDWSADWLHREAEALLEHWSTREHGTAFAALAAEAQGALRERLRRELRPNRYDAATGTLVVSDDRAAAIAAVAGHYRALFGGDPALASLRESYALAPRPLTDPERIDRLTQFFFWTAWACVTERPGESFSYTNNWPHDALVGNVPTAANVVWSLVSILMLLAGVGALVWWYFARSRHDEAVAPPTRDPLAGLTLTPSMRAIGKYAATVIALFLVQTLLGALLAHYTIEGDAFFGWHIAGFLPYAIVRTWHLQTAVFWIATAFLAAGLFLAPVIGGREPRFQRLGVNVLFGALLVVVTGSLAGEWLSVQQQLSLDAGFWFGHQGYEYVDLGRAWQIALYTGLVLWLVLMLRGIWPALQRGAEHRQLVTLLGASVQSTASCPFKATTRPSGHPGSSSDGRSWPTTRVRAVGKRTSYQVLHPEAASVAVGTSTASTRAMTRARTKVRTKVRTRMVVVDVCMVRSSSSGHPGQLSAVLGEHGGGVTHAALDPNAGVVMGQCLGHVAVVPPDEGVQILGDTAQIAAGIVGVYVQSVGRAHHELAHADGAGRADHVPAAAALDDDQSADESQSSFLGRMTVAVGRDGRQFGRRLVDPCVVRGMMARFVEVIAQSLLGLVHPIVELGHAPVDGGRPVAAGHDDPDLLALDDDLAVPGELAPGGAPVQAFDAVTQRFVAVVLVAPDEAGSGEQVVCLFPRQRHGVRAIAARDAGDGDGLRALRPLGRRDRNLLIRWCRPSRCLRTEQGDLGSLHRRLGRLRRMDRARLGRCRVLGSRCAEQVDRNGQDPASPQRAWVRDAVGRGDGLPGDGTEALGQRTRYAR